LKRTPKRYQNPVLRVWLAIFFSPKKYQFLHNTLFAVILFRLNTLKGTAKAPTVDLLRLKTLRGTKTAFLTPKRYDEHRRHFCMGVSPLDLLIGCKFISIMAEIILGGELIYCG